MGFPRIGRFPPELAREAHRGANLPPGLAPGLEAACTRHSPEFTVPLGAHVAVVEVSPDTGRVRIGRFVGVDNVGRVFSPLLREGQLHGIAQRGVEALREEIVYDATGQCLTSTLMDYTAPKAADVPR